MFIAEEKLGTNRSISASLDSFTEALRAIFVEGRAPDPSLLERVARGIVSAQQLLVGGPNRTAEPGHWTAVCSRPHQGGGCLRLEHDGSPHQQLNFMLDTENKFYSGFAWETGAAAYFFQLLPAGAGWTLQCATEQLPALTLNQSLPWTHSPVRGLPQPEAAWALPFSDFCREAEPAEAARVLPRAKICERCKEPLLEGAKYCQRCGAPVSVRSCSGCKRPLAPEARFCGSCGARCG